MYRLTIRRQWFLFVGSLLLFLGLVIFLPSHCPDKVAKTSLLLVLFGEILASFAFAYLFYQSAPLPQVIKAAATFLAVATGIGTIGNLTSQVNQPLPGTDVLISWVQLIIMNMGGLVATIALYEVQTGPGYRSIQEAAAEVVRSVKPRASVSATKLPAMPDPLHVTTPSAPPTAATPAAPTTPATRSGEYGQVKPKDLSLGRQTAPTPVSLQAMPLPPSQASAAASAEPALPEVPLAKPSEPASTGAPAGDQPKRGFTITSQRIQVQSKRKPSTFTKLQALSASGRSLTAPAGGGHESEGLKSILDRLEDQVDAAATPQPSAARQPAAKVQPQPEVVSAPPQPAVAKKVQAPTPVSTSKVEPTPTEQAPPKGGGSIVNRLVGVITKNRMPAAQKHAFKFDPEPEAAAEAASAPPVDKPEITIPPQESLDSAVLSGTQHPEVKALSDVGSFGPAQTDTPQSFAPVPAPQAFQAPATAEPQLPKSNIFEGVADDEMDQLFSKLVGTEAQREVQHEATPVAETHEQVESPASHDLKETGDFVVGEPEAEAEASVDHSYELPHEVEVPSAQSFPQAEAAQEHLFGEEVDHEIDDIFAALAPADAQREVTHPVEEEEAKEAEASAYEETEPAAHEEFEPVAHEEFEPVAHEQFEPVAHERFEPAAHEEVEPSVHQEYEPVAHEEHEPEVIAAAPESATDATQQGLFGEEEVSQEIDEIFANLAPPEAHLNVSDRAAVKGEPASPAVKPAQEVKSPSQMSFAPPPQPVAVRDQAITGEVPVQGEAEAEAEVEEGEAGYETPIVNPVTKNIEVREFGRLSSKSAVPKGQQSTTGTMKTIGKLLIDVQAIENIIKSGETGKVGSGLASARVITAARGEGIKALLGKIDSYQGVTGCLIVGHDGLVIASTVGGDEDKDALGALSSALLNTSNLATLKLEIGKLKQMVLLTNSENGQGNKPITTVLTDVDVGVLAVFLDTQQLDRLDGLLETIHTTIHG